MSDSRSSAAAAVRARLSHPVIDSDGHWVEFGPEVTDYLKRVGGAKAVEGFKSFDYNEKDFVLLALFPSNVKVCKFLCKY